jgi:hypothetical protein
MLKRRPNESTAAGEDKFFIQNELNLIFSEISGLTNCYRIKKTVDGRNKITFQASKGL